MAGKAERRPVCVPSQGLRIKQYASPGKPRLHVYVNNKPTDVEKAIFIIVILHKLHITGCVTGSGFKNEPLLFHHDGGPTFHILPALPRKCNEKWRQVFKRTGVTYTYESISHWDKDKRQSRAKRKCISVKDQE